MDNHGYPERHYELAPCRCGTALCRGRVTGSDWRRPELQERYGDEFNRS